MPSAMSTLIRQLREARINDAEDAAYKPLNSRVRTNDVAVVQAWADLVMAHPAVVDRWGHLPCDITAVDFPTANDGAPVHAAIYIGTGRIEIPKGDECTLGTLMHELAHRVCVADHGARVRHHGTKFLHAHLELVRTVFGGAFHDELYRQYVAEELLK